MAGEWIKLEASTIDKPEVFQFARLLGISKGEGLGLLIRFWMWLDWNCIDGVVDGCVDVDVDQLMRCPGFSGALRAVGWLKFDTDPPRMVIPNFDYHLSQSAKKRSEKNRIQARWRANVDARVDQSVDQPRSTNGSTREEKRRVLKQEGTRARAKVELPTGEHQTLAQELGLDCGVELLKYQDYFAANGKRHKDEVAGFRNWLRKAADLKPRRGVSNGRTAERKATLDGLTGRSEPWTRVVNEDD